MVEKVMKKLFSFIVTSLLLFTINTYAGITRDIPVAVAPPYHPGISVNRYYGTPTLGYTPQAVVADTLYVVPIYIPENVIITKLGFNVQVLAVGKVCRIGMYTSSQGVPATLLIDSGDISVATTGDKELTGSASLLSGTYYIALVCNGTPTLAFSTIAPYNFMLTGSTAALTAQETGVIGFVYAALPATIGAITYSAVVTEPRVWWRK